MNDHSPSIYTYEVNISVTKWIKLIYTDLFNIVPLFLNIHTSWLLSVKKLQGEMLSNKTFKSHAAMCGCVFLDSVHATRDSVCVGPHWTQTTLLTMFAISRNVIWNIFVYIQTVYMIFFSINEFVRGWIHTSLEI